MHSEGENFEFWSDFFLRAENFDFNHISNWHFELLNNGYNTLLNCVNVGACRGGGTVYPMAQLTPVSPTFALESRRNMHPIFSHLD